MVVITNLNQLICCSLIASVEESSRFSGVAIENLNLIIIRINTTMLLSFLYYHYSCCRRHRYLPRYRRNISVSVPSAAVFDTEAAVAAAAAVATAAATTSLATHFRCQKIFARWPEIV